MFSHSPLAVVLNGVYSSHTCTSKDHIIDYRELTSNGSSLSGKLNEIQRCSVEINIRQPHTSRHNYASTDLDCTFLCILGNS